MPVVSTDKYAAIIDDAKANRNMLCPPSM
jgi:hypothetical protein